MGGHVFEFSAAIGFGVVGHICVFEEEASDLIVYNIGGLLACEGSTFLLYMLLTFGARDLGCKNDVMSMQQ